MQALSVLVTQSSVSVALVLFYILRQHYRVYWVLICLTSRIPPSLIEFEPGILRNE